MNELEKRLRADFVDLIQTCSLHIEDTFALTNRIIRELHDEGILPVRNEYALTGLALEFKVKKTFADMGFNVTEGRQKNLEDLVLVHEEGFAVKSNIVVEIKSGRSSQVKRDDLRQLDDWVFELSGEEDARKWKPKKMGGMNIGASQGFWMDRIHPNPHKGVMIYNGPISEAYAARNNECINPNDEDFVSKRNFCIIPFPVLLGRLDLIQKCVLTKEELWEQMHLTVGILE